MRMQRDFLLSVTLAAATATAALGQTVTPSAGPADSATQGAASVPDFSGIWAHLTWPDVEPPLAGPGPVRNTSRRNGVSDVYQLVGDHTNPILKPQVAQVVKKAGDVALGGATYPTPSNQCWPGGVPFIFWNIGMQMIQQPGEITFLYSNDHEVRHVRMNQPHPTRVTPSWYGDSVGHYEGDTLVIDTVGVKIGPFAMVDMYGTPHSEALHVVERYRLLDYEAAKEAEERGEKENFRLPGSDPGFARDPSYKGKGLQLEFTVEDAGVFTMPWSATQTYSRALRTAWDERICAENVGHYYDFTYYSDKDAHIPTAQKPDF